MIFFLPIPAKVWHWPNDNESAQVLNVQFGPVLVFVWWKKRGFPWGCCLAKQGLSGHEFSRSIREILRDKTSPCWLRFVVLALIHLRILGLLSGF